MIDPGLLITEAHRAEQIRLHEAPRGYGQRGSKWAATVHALAVESHCGTILDYGCGQGSLGHALRARGFLAVSEYDPAIPGKASLPAPADLVVCTDVLEHVESATIWAVARHLAALTRHVLFLVVALVPTEKRLSDGRQAHILLRPVVWWRELLRAHDLVFLRELPAGAGAGPRKQWVSIWRRAHR